MGKESEQRAQWSDEREIDLFLGNDAKHELHKPDWPACKVPSVAYLIRRGGGPIRYVWKRRCNAPWPPQKPHHGRDYWRS